MTCNSDSGLGYRLGAYFNQDWDLLAPDFDGVIALFAEEETRTVVESTHNELKELLSSSPSEEALRALLFEMRCYYVPAAIGMSIKQWLSEIDRILVTALEVGNEQ